MAKELTNWFKKQVENNQGTTPAQLKSATELTKFGQRLESASPTYFRRHGKRRDMARKGAKWNMPDKEGNMPFPKRAKGACIYFGA